MLSTRYEVISGVANAVDPVEKMGIQVDWIDKAIGEIITKQELYGLVQYTRLLKEKLSEMKSGWSKLNFIYLKLNKNGCK